MNNNFSKNLKRIRKENNLSQEQLAEELNVSRQAISKWESSIAYPEMDKIITLCNKFNLNLDDLLNKDIGEVKKEEKNKNKLNKYIDDFLNFITDSVNLFSEMNFKTKLKLIVEELILIFILGFVSFIIMLFCKGFYANIYNLFPGKVDYYLGFPLAVILALFLLTTSIIILINVYKTRYLDYYRLIKKDNKRIEFKEKKNQIIIRDSNDYKFINALVKLLVNIIKLFSGFLLGIISLFLLLLLIILVMSFLITKTGVFFVGILIATSSLIVISILFLLILINFIFNRLSNKKKMIVIFLVALVLLGVGGGLTLIGFLNFDVIESNDNFITQKNVFKMQEDTFINYHYNYIKYIPKDIDNIEIEYKANKNCQIKTINLDNNITFERNCNNFPKVLKSFIKEVNNKKIILINDESFIKDVVVYASNENISKLNDNYNQLFK